MRKSAGGVQGAGGIMSFFTNATRVGAIVILILMQGDDAKSQGAEATLRVHTTREKELIEPLLRVFEGLTRVKLEVTYLAGNGLDRLKADAEAGKSDLFIAAEFSQLVAAKAMGITEPVGNADLLGRVPEQYRDAEGHWFGLTRRMRVIGASRQRVHQKSFTYEDLADPRWTGRICARSGFHPYNVSLVAAMIAHKGEAGAETWLRGLKSNLAGKPTGGDRDQVTGVHAGRCDLALVNSYYVGSLRTAKDRPDQQAAGHSIEIVFPNAADRGAHVSVSGMALIKDAPGLNNAALLMDFMTSAPAQFVYAQDNHEHPIRDDVKLSGLVASWGSPKLDAIPLGDIAKLMPQALAMVTKVGFDNGPGS